MRNCPKCGSYVPEGKICCPACGRLNIGLSKDMQSSRMAERHRTGSRFEAASREVKRDAPLLKQKNNPYAGGTYEQHKSHDPNRKEYYRTKYSAKQNEKELTKRIFCAAAYFGIFFFLPLAAMPNSKEAKFHANQGLVLFLFGTLLGALASTAEVVLGGVFSVLNILYPLLMVYGAYNAFNGNMTELPVIGKIKILKNYTDF